jgi:glycosyltransferase involved in cell wall biosynthesis
MMSQETTPTVSVVVPNYNHARYLQKRMDSVWGQTYQDFEVILLDDCSTDESRKIIAGYWNDPRVRIEVNERNSGSAFKQWNKGVALARGKYVWIAESDDHADKRLLERLVAVLDAEPATALVSCRSWRVSADDRLDGFADWYFVDLGPNGWTVDFCVDGYDVCRNYLVHCNTIPNASAVLFRKAAFERVGGADESLVLGADWKLWAAMALTGKVAYVSEPLNYFRFHDTSVRSQGREARIHVAESLRIIRWILGQISVTDATLEGLLNTYCDQWVRAVLNPRVPLRFKRAILRDVKAIDPRPMRRALRPGFRAVQQKLAAIFLWHG